MQFKLSQVNTKTNWDDIRKEQMKQILDQGTNMTNDDVVYIKHCIKNFSGPTAYLWLETHLKEDQINEIIKHIKIATNNDGTNAIYLVQEGELRSKTKTYKKAEVVVNEEVEFTNGSVAFQIDRKLFEQFKNSAELQELQVKVQNISRCIPIRNLDIQKKQSLLQLFKETKKKFGSIMTVPGGGTSNLYFQTSGNTLLFTSTKQHNFIIIGSIKNSGVFNEQKVLFDQESKYGSICINESTLYQLSSQDISKLSDECIQSLRGGFQAKQIIFNSIIDKVNSFTNDDQFIEYQEQICQRHNIDYSKILDVISKNTKNGKIESTDKQEQIEKNTLLFDKTIGSNRMNTALNQMNDRERTLLMGTPRIVNKQSTFLGLSQQQETSLFALRQLATDLRKGTSTTQTVQPMAKETIARAKQALLQEEKMTTGADLLQRKSIASKLQDEKEQKIFQKMKKQNQELLQEYPAEVKNDVEISQQQNEKELQQNQEQEQELNNNNKEEFEGRKQIRQSSIKGQQTMQQMEISKKKNLLQSLV